jgi:hypothetical protein
MDQEPEAPKPKSQPSRIDAAYILKAFTYHAPVGDQAERYSKINAVSAGLAGTIMYNCPESPERTLAIRCLQEARMWANSSIAINEGV